MSTQDYQHCVIQGGCGGIGLAVATWLLVNSSATLSITCRHAKPCTKLTALQKHYGDRVTTLTLDLCDTSGIKKVWNEIGVRDLPVDLLVNASGLLHADGVSPEKRLEDLTGDALNQLFSVNATGPALVIAHGVKFLARRRRVVIANLSARVGSIGDNALGGWYGYRASKAALNMLTHTFAIELRRRLPDAVCVAMHPGTVATDLSLPFQRNVPAQRLFTPTVAADHMMRHLATLSAQDSGGFFAWDGRRIEW